MALTITKNDISGVYGTPAPLKITKGDISSVYEKQPAAPGYYSALSKPPLVSVAPEWFRVAKTRACPASVVVGRWQNDSFDGGVTAKQQSTGTSYQSSPFKITKSDISTVCSPIKKSG